MAEYFNKQNLKDRGWTEAGIKKFLGSHDTERPNPIYKKAAPQKLYEKKKVLQVEASADFQAWMTTSQKRKQAANAATETKRENLICDIQEIAFEIPKLPIVSLLKRACEHYNERQFDRRTTWLADPQTSDPDFLARISCNYLRHVLSDYEWELRDLYGQVGKDEAYNIIKDKVTAAINTVYPNLTADIDLFQQGMPPKGS